MMTPPSAGNLPADLGMGYKMSSAQRWSGRALGLVFAVALLALAVSGPVARAAPTPVEPAAAMTVTVVLDQAGYLSGDSATARAIVYRTPGPVAYNYTWRALGAAFQILNETNGTSDRYAYEIPLDYVGTIRFEATVDDGLGLVVVTRQSAAVSLAVMSLVLDRGDFRPGDSITATYGVVSNVIRNPTYDYEVDDTTGTIVSSGSTLNTSFTFPTPDPASRTYTFHVTARDGGNSTETVVSISQATGFVLGVTFDKASYAVGETIRAHLTLTTRGTTALPSQFRWSLSISLGSPSVSAITTTPQVDLILVVPPGTGSGEILVFAIEAATGSVSYQTVRVGASTTNPLWSTEIGGMPAFAVFLGLLFILVLLAVLGLWRRISGGPLIPRPAEGTPGAPGSPPPPPPPEEAVRAPASSPMSIACKRCGKPIDITTSRRPIEVMCPACGEPQFVT